MKILGNMESQGRRLAPPLAGNAPLLLIDEVAAAVLLPTGFVGFHAERLFLAVADRLDAVGVNSSSNQCVLHGGGTGIAKGQVVLG